MSTKTDARKLGAATQAHLRRLVVLAVRAGMKQTEAAEKYQVSLRAVNKWVAMDRTGGLKALKPKRRGRPLSSDTQIYAIRRHPVLRSCRFDES